MISDSDRAVADRVYKARAAAPVVAGWLRVLDRLLGGGQ